MAIEQLHEVVEGCSSLPSTDEAERIFSELTSSLDYSMLIVTSAVADERAGCLVGFATQCSIEPPRFLVCLSEQNRTLRVAARSNALVVHFVQAGDEALVELFGSRTGDELDKFERCEWHSGPRGLPVLDGCRRWFAGAILERRSLGDHVGYVLEPFAAESREPAKPFPFARAKRFPAGHPS
jgi:flavin reductase (DIM6/NTAB) family NADH-FMN oxidoreductase RutF